jgi:hypothetical protein
MENLLRVSSVLFSFSLFSVHAHADGPLSTDTGSWSRETVTVTTPRHGQGTFTIYRHADENRDEAILNRRQPDQDPGVTYHYSYPDRYPGYRDYRNTPYYYQQPVRKYSYYPEYYGRRHRDPGYYRDRQKPVEHYNVQQCMGPHC